MKTIGLLGGLSFVSTIDYYRQINTSVNEILGKRHSAKIILNSIDFEEIKQHLNKDWEPISTIMHREMVKLAGCGVDGIWVCNNTLHKAVDMILPKLDIEVPVFHIVDCLGERARDQNYKTVLLLGTQFTMEDGFYSDRLKSSYNIDVVIPQESERQEIHSIIMNELVKDVSLPQSKERVLHIINQYPCDAVVLGCTELPVLIQPGDCATPVLNTVEIHCAKAVEFALM